MIYSGKRLVSGRAETAHWVTQLPVQHSVHDTRILMEMKATQEGNRQSRTEGRRRFCSQACIFCSRKHRPFLNHKDSCKQLAEIANCIFSRCRTWSTLGEQCVRRCTFRHCTFKYINTATRVVQILEVKSRCCLETQNVVSATLTPRALSSQL